MSSLFTWFSLQIMSSFYRGQSNFDRSNKCLLSKKPDVFYRFTINSQSKQNKKTPNTKLTQSVIKKQVLYGVLFKNDLH